MEYLENLEELDQVPWRTLCLFSAFPPPIDLGRNPSNVQCQHCFKNVCQIKLSNHSCAFSLKISARNYPNHSDHDRHHI